MLRINCFFKAAEGKYHQALQAAMALVAKSQEHAGCLGYDVFESATRPEVFVIVETWESQEMLDKHMATPEFQELVPQIEACGLLKIEVMPK